MRNIEFNAVADDLYEKVMSTRVILALILLLFTTASASNARADDNIFYVTNIHVFYEAGNLKDSKKIAVELGIQDALKKLMIALTPSSAHKRIENLQIQDLRKFVKHIQFNSERMTSHSYMGDMDVEFDPDNVKALLSSSGMMYTTKRFESFIIIPFLKNSIGWFWFSGDWKMAWDRLPAQLGMVRPSIVSGNLQDIEDMNLGRLMVAKYVDFINLLTRYRVDELVLIEASQYGSSMELNVRFLGEKTDNIESISYEQEFGESDAEWYQRIANDVLKKIDARWKGDKRAFSTK